MSERDLEAWKSYDDSMVHFVSDGAPFLTLCGVYIIYLQGSRNTGLGLDVDCMTCLVRVNQPSFSDHIASALQIPKELLYGK